MIKFVLTTTLYIADDDDFLAYLDKLLEVGHPRAVLEEVRRCGHAVWRNGDCTTTYTATRIPDHCPLCGAPGHGDKECSEIPF
jgi:rubrerythrin